MYFWRTLDHQEVDLLIENKGKLIAAIEIKSAARVSNQYLSGLRSFATHYPGVPLYAVARVPEAYDENGVTVLPWEKYLSSLADWLR